MRATADVGGAELRATAAGESADSGATAAEAAEEKDFVDERQIVLDRFLDEWKLELSAHPVAHAFNPRWPENRMATNQKRWFTRRCTRWVSRSTKPSSPAIFSCPS